MASKSVLKKHNECLGDMGRIWQHIFSSMMTVRENYDIGEFCEMQ